MDEDEELEALRRKRLEELKSQFQTKPEEETVPQEEIRPQGKAYSLTELV